MSAPAAAEDWWLVSQSDTFAGFIDQDSLKGWNWDRTGTLWRIDYRTASSGAKSTMAQVRWNCIAHTMTPLSSVTYDRYGEEMGGYRAADFELREDHVGRETVARAELDFICDNDSRLRRFAVRVEVPPVVAVDKAVRLRRLGLSLTDAFTLAVADPMRPDRDEMIEKLVPPEKRRRAAAILARYERDEWEDDRGETWRRGWDSNPR